MIDFRVHRCLEIEAAIARINAGNSANMGGKHESLADMEFVARLVAF